MRVRSTFLATLIASLLAFAFVSAWTGPTGTPPSNNASAPINVGNVNQTKNANLGVNGLAVFGNTLLGGSAGSNAYLNFGATSGSGGYGFRDNAGVMQYSNSAGGWTNFTGGSSQWTTSGSNIYYSSGNVGIGTVSPTAQLTIVNTAGSGIDLNTTNGTGYLIIDSTGGANYIESGLSRTSGSAAPLYFTNIFASSIPMAIAANGKVGINNVSPTTRLDVTGSINASSYCISESNCISAWPSGGGSGGQWVNGSAGAIYYTGGDVGIGVSSPTQALDVNGWLGTRGSTGWVNITYGTELWSQDSTWVRVTPDLYVNGGFDTGGASGVGCAGALGGGYTFRVCGTGDVTGDMTAAAFLYSSDERLKKDIAPLADNLSKVLQIQPVSYLWIDPSRGTGEQIGFIAQQVQQIVPEIVHTDASTTLESVDYARITPLLVGSVQELNQKIQSQQTQLDAQQQEINVLQAQLQTLENK